MISGKIALSASSLLACCSVCVPQAHSYSCCLAAIPTQGCTEGSNLACTSSVEKDLVLKSFLRCLLVSSCCGYMFKVWGFNCIFCGGWGCMGFLVHGGRVLLGWFPCFVSGSLKIHIFYFLL